VTRQKQPRLPRRGDSVLVLSVPPPIKTMPLETRRAFKLSVGHRFKVRGIDEAGLLELMVGRVVDKAVGGFMNTIWIEPEFVKVVRRKRAG
jgi:hypothetical protein